MVLILIKAFKTTLNLWLKNIIINWNPLVHIYVNSIKNRIVDKIKTGYKLELLPLETMTLLGSTKRICDEDKDKENVPELEPVN